MTDEKSQPGFWHSIPGILTATATVITALTGLVGGLYQAGILGDKKIDSVPPPTTDKPVLEQPAAQNNPGHITPPAELEKPAVTQTVTQEPAVEQAAQEKPADEKPTVVPLAPAKIAVAQPAMQALISAQRLKTKPQQDNLPQLSGRYSVRGKNVRGGSFSGTVSIVGQEGHYRLVFDRGNKIFHGEGELEGKVLQVKWEHRLVTYTLRDNGELEGTWDDGAGSEILVPIAD